MQRCVARTSSGAEYHQGFLNYKAEYSLGVGFSKEPKDCAPEALWKPMGLVFPNHFALLKNLL